MEVRDAVEGDAEALADIADAPIDAMRTIIHDRSVRVAIEDADRIVGFVSFDAQPRAVHVTQLDGERAACERLLAEPVAFARSEDMTVEFLIPEGESEVRDVAEAAGFEHAGRGPQFDGAGTIRYRLQP